MTTRRDDDVIPNLKPSARLTLLALTLRDDLLPIACDPTKVAPQYRPAVRECVAVARQMVREYTAMECRENWKRSAAISHAHNLRPTMGAKNQYGPGYTED